MEIPVGEVSQAAGRLKGKVAIITGAGGNIGRDICERFLVEGAGVAMLGRDGAKLNELSSRIGGNVLVVPCDVADSEQTRRAVADVIAHFGRIDILVNNAGSAGPRRRLVDIPLTKQDLTAQQEGQRDGESAQDALHNIFGLSWNMVRALVPHLKPGASIVNVSSIFSRTIYFGRTAYVVPKAALNTWSRRLAYELGSKGIRVNTVLPGPIAGDRISSVFASMDALRDAKSGTTANEVLGTMTLMRGNQDATPERSFPTTTDVVNAILFLAGDDSSAINGHNFEITHGMVVPQESRSTLVSRPGSRIVDATGSVVLVVAGRQSDEALEVARIHAERGASVLFGVPGKDELARVRTQLAPSGIDVRINPVEFDRRDAAGIERTLRGRILAGAVILPFYEAGRFQTELAGASDEDVRAFIDDELFGSMSIARELARHFTRQKASPALQTRVIFISNGDDGHANVYADILRAAQEQLGRVWRDEAARDGNTKRASAEWISQIVRFTNAEAESLRFAASWSTKLIYGKRRVTAVNLYLPNSLEGDTGARKATFGDAESLIGLHLGKTALITGGSAGIGAQIGRLLAIAGARVVLAARETAKLKATYDELVEELEAIGYDDARARVAIIDNIDVADEASLQRCVTEALQRYGRVDYLINNAGIAGAEQMIVDMPLDAFRATLRANLVSNFSLMARLIPEMKRHGSGYVVNVSSYFGGEKYVAVSYPNRADYAVSKAGQRALVETMAAFVGPEIQFNAIAPGPVDGVRLRGVGGGPGLFERRGRLIVENQRLNVLYGALVEHVRDGEDARAFFDAARKNDIDAIVAEASSPARLRALCESIVAGRPSYPEGSSWQWLANTGIMTRLVERAKRAGYLPAEYDASIDAAPPEPYVGDREIARNAEKVRSGVLKMLHLHKMPTETEVALATVFYLADRAISGETFHPSGGLKQDRSITERELLGRSKEERVERMRGRTVWIVGESPVPQLARAVATYLTDCQAGRVVLMTRTASTGTLVREKLLPDQAAKVEFLTIGMDIEAGLARARSEFSSPAAVVSMPMGLLPTAIFEGAGHVSGPAFETLLEEQVTNHFRVARFVSLFDDARLILVSPEVALGGNAAEFAFASFIKTTLHALTATAAVENERLVNEVPVNQINLARQVQDDEPRNLAEAEEKAERFARAIVLESGPFATARESRYRARIYRGISITV